MSGIPTPPGVEVAEEVRAALAEGRPVVALESTIISHGLPRPRNLSVARDLESILREAGVVPATVGVIAGQPTVGLSAAELELLATESSVAKAGVRELPVVSAKRLHAATTVASTAYLAHRSGIRVFATGGIGGVHRGAAETFDESADLRALATTPITVVCAGVKSVLDIEATLERLESLGVSVVGWRTGTMPGFFVADTGIELEWSVENGAQVAEMMVAADRLGLASAIVVATPVPVDHELDPQRHAELLAEALASARRDGITGKAVTPYLLDHMLTSSSGESLEANVWAVRNNVAVAAEIARAMSW